MTTRRISESGFTLLEVLVASMLMAIARWNAAELECGKYDAMKAAREMIEREVAAATNGEGENGEAMPAAATPEKVMRM